jgi:hypothetical protein
MVCMRSGMWVAIIHRPARSTTMPAMNRVAPGPWARREAAMPIREAMAITMAGMMWSATSLEAST